MPRCLTAIMVLSLTGALAAAGGKGDRADRPRGEKSAQAAKALAPSRSAPLGSIARQLDLKLRTMRAADGEQLAQAIQHNRQQWASLSAEQRDQYRRKALAFLQARPEDQDRLLQYYEKLVNLSAQKRDEYRQRAQWLKVVVASFTAQQRQELQAASPKEKASRLLQRKEELIREGKLPASFAAPASRTPRK